jgi:hypothetical protein
MNWHVVTVARDDLGLTLGAIRLGEGIVTATKLLGDDIAITYVTGHGGKPLLASTSPIEGERIDPPGGHEGARSMPLRA